MPTIAILYNYDYPLKSFLDPPMPIGLKEGAKIRGGQICYHNIFVWRKIAILWGHCESCGRGAPSTPLLSLP